MDAKHELIVDEMSETIIRTARTIAMTEGAEQVNVRRILQTLSITNRVFYNRFHNIDEVLERIYQEMVLKVRSSIRSGFDPEGDFFGQVLDIVSATLTISYDSKMKLYKYVYETDSVSDENFVWWRGEIARIIEIGKARGLLRDVDTQAVSYAVWCFIRGYNADAIGRGIPKAQAEAEFRYTFGLLLEGMKA